MERRQQSRAWVQRERYVGGRQDLVCIDTAYDGAPEGMAAIYKKNRKPTFHFLSPDTKAALGGDKKGYFLAERIGNVWFIEERQRGGWSW